ncbi:hypothetical protein ACFFRR_007442 [Megaselia abdita]
MFLSSNWLVSRNFLANEKRVSRNYNHFIIFCVDVNKNSKMRFLIVLLLLFISSKRAHSDEITVVSPIKENKETQSVKKQLNDSHNQQNPENPFSHFSTNIFPNEENTTLPESFKYFFYFIIAISIIALLVILVKVYRSVRCYKLQNLQ